MLQNLEAMEGRELSFAGIITDVQHRVSKNGKPWGTFTFEDYSDAFEFRLFNEDYLKFRHFLIPNTFLYLKTSLRRAWQNGDVRVQITAMQQLQDVLEKMAKKITIHLPIEQINKERVESIQEVFKRHKGNQHLNFTIFDKKENLRLTMPSRTAKINISKELLSELSENQCSFKLN
jgi:DNA polymerase-3 subunit alpha